VIAALLALVLSLSACSLGSDNADSQQSPTASTGEIPAVTDNGPDAEPTIAKPTGDAPTTLLSKDLVVGTGAEAQPGSTVEVNYTGIAWSTGETFDSSWLRGQTATFPLANLIKGWQEGIPGMKVGGRRVLVIPPDLAYGGSASPLANETLVFVIELKAGL
jgi:peptidylprolyl isomerase